MYFEMVYMQSGHLSGLTQRRSVFAADASPPHAFCSLIAMHPLSSDLLDQLLLLQVLHNLRNTLLHTVLMRLNHNLGRIRSLIRRRNPRKVLDLASPRLLIQALGVALLRDLNGDIDIHLDECKRRIAALAAAVGVQVARDLAVSNVRRDEAGQGDGGAVGEQLGDLGDAADVLVAVRLREAQVLVEPEAHVIAVEPVRRVAQVQEVLLERGRDGGLARGGQAREPDREALLLAEGLALGAREGWVPGDVAGLWGRGRLAWGVWSGWRLAS